MLRRGGRGEGGDRLGGGGERAERDAVASMDTREVRERCGGDGYSAGGGVDAGGAEVEVRRSDRVGVGGEKAASSTVVG